MARSGALCHDEAISFLTPCRTRATLKDGMTSSAVPPSSQGHVFVKYKRHQGFFESLVPFVLDLSLAF